MHLSLHTLPVDVVYRVLDHLTDIELFLSIANVCQRLNNILHSYYRYQVDKYTKDIRETILVIIIDTY